MCIHEHLASINISSLHNKKIMLAEQNNNMLELSLIQPQ